MPSEPLFKNLAIGTTRDRQTVVLRESTAFDGRRSEGRYYIAVEAMPSGQRFNDLGEAKRAFAAFFEII